MSFGLFSIIKWKLFVGLQDFELHVYTGRVALLLFVLYSSASSPQINFCFFITKTRRGHTNGKPKLFQCCCQSLKNSLYQRLDSNNSLYRLLLFKHVVLEGMVLWGGIAIWWSVAPFCFFPCALKIIKVHRNYLPALTVQSSLGRRKAESHSSGSHCYPDWGVSPFRFLVCTRFQRLNPQ